MTTRWLLLLAIVACNEPSPERGALGEGAPGDAVALSDIPRGHVRVPRGATSAADRERIETILAMPPPEPRRAPDCDRPEVEACFRRFSKPSLTSTDVAELYEDGIRRCTSHRTKGDLEQQGRCLPVSVGKDARNGQTVEAVYFCSDICPASGTVMLRYRGVTWGECCELGGYPAFDPAWGGYRGCTPPERPLGEQVAFTTDRRKVWVKRNPCTGEAVAARPCDL